MNTSNLEAQFDTVMHQIYVRAKSEANYTASIFLRMLDGRRGISTAKYLINAEKQSDGYTALYLKCRLDLTVEALVVEQEQWHPLFTSEEIEKAKNRLRQNQYKFKLN